MNSITKMIKYISFFLATVIIFLNLNCKCNLEFSGKTKMIKSMILNSKPLIENKMAILEKENCLKESLKLMNSKKGNNSDCDKLSDNEKSTFAYLMTDCIYSNLKRKLDFECEYKDFRCCKYLHGDSWNTFLNSLSSIENYCLYYKISDWEEQLARNMENLLNSSLLAIEIIELSKSTFNEIIKKQESFSNISQTYFSSTINHLETISQASANYKEFENNLKNSFFDIENQVKKSNTEIKNLYNFIDDKIDFIQSINYVFSTMTKYSQYSYMKNYYVYFSLFVFLLYFFNLKLEGFRFYLLLELIIFYLIEFYLNLLIESRFSNDFNINGVLFIDVGINMFFTSLRILYTILSILSISVFYYINRTSCRFDLVEENKEKIKSKNYSENILEIDNKIKSSIDELKSGIMKTPIWINKFLSRVNCYTNESLLIPKIPSRIINNNNFTNYSFKKDQYDCSRKMCYNNYSENKNRYFFSMSKDVYNKCNSNNKLINEKKYVNESSINIQNISKISDNKNNKNEECINTNETRKKLNFIVNSNDNKNSKNVNTKNLMRKSNEKFSSNLA